VIRLHIGNSGSDWVHVDLVRVQAESISCTRHVRSFVLGHSHASLVGARAPQSLEDVLCTRSTADSAPYLLLAHAPVSVPLALAGLGCSLLYCSTLIWQQAVKSASRLNLISVTSLPLPMSHSAHQPASALLLCNGIACSACPTCAIAVQFKCEDYTLYVQAYTWRHSHHALPRMLLLLPQVQ
jgi:hypothetical protein